MSDISKINTNDVSIATIADQHGAIAKIILENTPIFKSFKVALNKTNAIIACNKEEEKHFRLFNNKVSMYDAKSSVLTNEEFKTFHKQVKDSIVYHIQDWGEWIRVYENKYIYRERVAAGQGSILLNHNAIAYCVIKADEGKYFPFAYVCELAATTEYNMIKEVEDCISEGIIDYMIDLLCEYGSCENWHVLAVMPLPNSKYVSKQIAAPIKKKMLK